MRVSVPTLSKAGWSKGIAEKIDYLLSDFFTSEYSQSYLFSGSVSSLTYLIQRYQNDIPGLVDMTRQTLEDYFRSYFESVIVEVKSDAGSIENPSNLVSLKIFCQVTENGRQYSAAKLIETIDSKIKRIVDLNNFGTPV